MSLRKILAAVRTKKVLTLPSVTAVLLWSSMLGSSVMAQTGSDTPLDAAALAALAAELKEVVAKSTPD
ncbi:MAG TPA: hypothetical protein VN256_12465 [Pyrinomonadaceae bacterium]|nr:hypothetical protein [Pyrinomonadaceae bacterium]